MSTFDKYDAPMLFGKVGERSFHAMAKPTGSTCDLDCTYCYYPEQGTTTQGFAD
jgi:sulfatase maturation enzyme AslB (radical SAM superfamily)